MVTKRRIAREWLILVAAIIAGLFVTYGAFYFGRTVTWEFAEPSESTVGNRAAFVRERPFDRIDGRLWVVREYSKHKNAGDLLNDLRSGEHAPSPFAELPLWLCVVSPYFIFCFVRSIIWSVNALRST